MVSATCTTTGVGFCYCQVQKFAGGGYFKIVNQSVHIALLRLGYTAQQIEDIEKYCKGRLDVGGCPCINRKH